MGASVLLFAVGGLWFFLYHTIVSGVKALSEKDTVVLADFANSTGDAVFDGTLRQGMAIQLEQSPFLSLISDERIQHTLGLMGQPADARFTPQLAHEVCERTGSAAVLEGSIAPIGDQYILGLRAKNCRDGDVLDEEQVQVARKEDVLNALGKIAGKFRTRVGESLTTIEQHNTPLPEATTPSLEALKAYSLAWKVLITTGNAAAIPLYQRAVEIDPQFAMAYGMLGRAYADLGEWALGAESTSKAWQLRGRTSDAERFFLEASYEMLVTGNLEKSQTTCETWARTYPRQNNPYGFLSGLIYPVQGKYDKAIATARRSIEYDPDFVFGYNILAFEDIAVGDLRGAELALQKADERKLKIPDLSIARYQIAFLKDDQTGMDRVISQTRREPETEDWVAHFQSTVFAYRGQLRQATATSRRSIELARRAQQPERAALFQTAEAIRDAFFDDKTAAVQNAEAALKLSRGRDVSQTISNDDFPKIQPLSPVMCRRFVHSSP